MPAYVQLFFPGVWHGERDGSKVYLSFDDGPVPGITDFVLDQLALRGMKATFFMVGENVSKNPELARRVRSEGHGIGNHTYNHLNARKVSTACYLDDIEKCQRELFDKLGVDTKLFRPPYGRLRYGQSSIIQKSYKLVYWEVISGDYKLTLSPDEILVNVSKKTRTGSIVLFHDQEKTSGKVKLILPRFLDFLVEKGFQTEKLC